MSGWRCGGGESSTVSLVRRVVTHTGTGGRHVILPRKARREALGTTSHLITSRITSVVLVNGPTRVGDLTTRCKLGRVKRAAVVSPGGRRGGTTCTSLLFRLHRGGNVAPRGTTILMRSPLFLTYLVVGSNSTSNRVTNTRGAANGILHPTLRVVGATPNVDYISNTFLVFAGAPRCNGRNVLMFTSYTMVPGPATPRLTDVTVTATTATHSVMKVRPHITVLDFSAGNDTSRRVISGIIRTAHLTGRVTPSLGISKRLRTSTTLIRGITSLGTPNDSITKRTGILMFPALRINGVTCGLIRHLKNTRTMNPVLRNVTTPIGSLSHNYSISSVCGVITVTYGRSVNLGTGGWFSL